MRGDRHVQGIYEESDGTAEVGAVGRRTENKGRDYGEWWGARSTGSYADVEELTWFVR